MIPIPFPSLSILASSVCKRFQFRGRFHWDSSYQQIVRGIPMKTAPEIGIVYTQNVQGLTGKDKGLESLVDPIVDLMIPIPCPYMSILARSVCKQFRFRGRFHWDSSYYLLIIRDKVIQVLSRSSSFLRSVGGFTCLIVV